MTQKRKRWTAEEDRVLLDQVKRHANNLQEGFRESARLLNRTKYACKYRWYSYAMHSPEANVCFATIGYRTKNVNRKNVSKRTSDNTEKKSTCWWKSILKFLKLR